MKKRSVGILLKVERICELEQDDKISFGIIAFIDREINSVYKLIFWLFSQKKTNRYRVENYIGRTFECIAKNLGISEVKACELLLEKLEFTKTLGFETAVNEAILNKIKIIKKELHWAKGRKEGLKHG